MKNEVRVNHFHINRKAREKVPLSAELFLFSGDSLFDDFAVAKKIAEGFNDSFKKSGENRFITPGNLYAMGVIDELNHFVFNFYNREIDSNFLAKFYKRAVSEFGNENVEKLLVDFVAEFPPKAVYENKMSAKAYLNEADGGFDLKLTEIKELIMLKIANENPAFFQFKEFLDDSVVSKNLVYPKFFILLELFFEESKKNEINGVSFSLLEFLRAPFKKFPNSLSGQLLYIKENWGFKLLKSFLAKILLALDVIKEENRPRFVWDGTARQPVITKESLAGDSSYGIETESFSKDSQWMPCVVMIAKNVFVWLDQLSKLYAKEINSLDKIPDDELRTLSRRGFTGLWLIGLWERSRASKRIKQIMGNGDAAASAYSLYDYEIAQDLGGEAALQNLKERAWRYGIRLASDMVPNHAAIDSKWVNEHPERFISLENPPFPSYSYRGENLSSDPNVGVYIEDGYFTKKDAAVTFKRVDFKTGKTLYIYHGNDGTCMPWNDTAQLNYLREDTREEVIKTIVKIAKKFPIIRFDAAMTLAKKHYHRLWFPEPGSGGDIASRSEHGMSVKQFNSLFPKEFWREVVDRVAAEAPGTLLLAEAFWLMEGYFVRTLGMHRVYNSAFMNFMKNEENGKYRESIKNVLEFDPCILERYVNFLNNPDEKTAIEQFGDGDKYFGVTLLMVTMPGLPMFGHGQIEGFSEKYGMEYRRAYWNESINWDLVRRHEREIFPLTRYRPLFARVDNFYLYDFYKNDGSVDEDVFAYSNGCGDKRVLVFYHNKYSETEGWIKTSAAFLDKASGKLKRINLDFALGICFDKNGFVKYRDFISGLQYIISVSDLFEHGFFIHLSAYKYYVFSDFEVVFDSVETPWGELSQQLNGKGISDVEAALNKIRYSALLDSFCKVVNAESFQLFARERDNAEIKSANSQFYQNIVKNYANFIEIVSKFEDLPRSNPEIARLFIEDLRAALYLPLFNLKSYDREALNYLCKNLSGNRYYLFMLLGFISGARLSMIFDSYSNDASVSLKLFLKYGLDNFFKELFQTLGFSDYHSERLVKHIRAFIYYQNWWKLYDFNELPQKLTKEIFENDDIKTILQINEYDGAIWFNKEAFEDFTAGLFVISALEILRNSSGVKEKRQNFKRRYSLIKKILKTSELSGYRVDRFLELLAVDAAT